MNAEQDWPAAIELLHARLDAAFDAALAFFAHESDALDARATKDGWSTREVGDHLALANRYLLILVRKLRDKSLARAERGESFPCHAPVFEPLEKLASRELGWVHPEHMAPRAGASAAGVSESLRAQRNECLQILDQAPDGVGTLHGIRMSVAGQQKFDLYQYLLIIALHLERHVAQMERNRAAS